MIQIALCVAVALLVCAGQAAAIPPTAKTTTFHLPESIHASSIAFDANGSLWFAGTPYLHSTSSVGRLKPDGTFETFPIERGSGQNGATSITPGPDGAMWFAEPRAGAIGRVTHEGQVTTFPLGQGAQPAAIVAGSDGNLWFTEPANGRVGQITTSGQVAEIQFGRRSRPADIVLGPDRHVWFTMPGAGKIGRITPTGQPELFPVPGATPWEIVAGPNAVWFTETDRKKRVMIGRISTSGHVTHFRLPAALGAARLAVGPDGKVWFVTRPRSAALEWLSPTGELGSRVCLGDYCTLPPDSIAFAPNGELWFAASKVCVYCGGGTGQMLAMAGGYVGQLGGPGSSYP